MDLNEVKQATLRWKVDPTSFDRDVFGITEFDQWELEADRIHATEKFMAISSGRGTGKTNYLARRMWRHHLCCYPALTIASGPKKETIRDGLMPALRVWHDRLPEFFKQMWAIGSDRIVRKDAPEMSAMLLRTASKQNPDGIKGPRLPYMLIVGDEYSGISDDIHKRLVGFLTTTYGRFIAMSQPTVLDGPFHRMFHQSRSQYRTMHVSSLASRHVDRGYVQSIADEFGEDSDDYRIDVLGLFPQASSSTLISLDLVKRSMARVAEEQIARPVWGYDHAEGGDRCALAKRRGAVQLEPVMWWREKDPVKSCERIADQYERTAEHLKPAAINVDASVIGSEAVRILQKLKVPGVHRVLIGLPARDKRYANVRTWLAFRAREWAREDGVFCDDPDLHAEVVQQTYARTAAGKLNLTVKEDDYAHNSPDLWDAWCQTFAERGMEISEVKEAA